MSETYAPYHHGGLREALVTAALEMLESGLPFSLRAVAREVGVSPTAPYRHFADREHLEAAVAVRGFHELEDQLRVAMHDGPSAPADLAVVYVQYAIERPALFRLMFGRPCDDGDDERVAATAAIGALIHEVAAAVAPEADADAATLAVWAYAHGLAMLHLDGKLDNNTPDEIADEVRKTYAALASTAREDERASTS